MSFRPYTKKLPPGGRRLLPLAGQLFLIEGNIGAGKTTLGERIVRFLTDHGIAAAFLPERFPQETLRSFIAFSQAHPGERNIYAFELQTRILEHRIETYAQALVLQRQGVCVFVDRSLPGDYVFALLNYREKNITDAEWLEYQERVAHCDLLEPTGILNLKSPPPVCFARVHCRQRDGEDLYPLSYLVKVAATYAEVLPTLPYPRIDLDYASGAASAAPEISDAACSALARALIGIIGVDQDFVVDTLVLE